MNKNILIVGVGDGGIGDYIALQLLDMQFKIIIITRNAHSLNEKILKYSDSVNIYECDLSNVSQLEYEILNILNKYSEIYAYIHNAAPNLPYVPINQLSFAHIQEEYSVILLSTIIITKYVKPKMIISGGRIIFLGSNAATSGTVSRSASYGAFKSGLIGLCKNLAIELGQFNITVNVVSPSQTLTKRVLKNNRKTIEDIYAQAKKRSPLLIPACVNNVGDVICFICSNKAAYITGQNIIVDGGTSLNFYS